MNGWRGIDTPTGGLRTAVVYERARVVSGVRRGRAGAHRRAIAIVVLKMRVENLLIVRGERETLALMKGDYQDSRFDRGDGRRDERLRGICTI